MATKDCFLRLVVLDKAHLHVRHGTSFWEEIHRLKDVFFQPVFILKAGTVPAGYVHPRFCAATGIFAHNYLQALFLLTTIGFPQKTVQWSSPAQFAQQNIYMNFISSTKHVKILDKIATIVKNKPDEYCCIFIGSKQKSFKLEKALKKKLNSKLFTVIGIVHKTSRRLTLTILPTCKKIQIME